MWARIAPVGARIAVCGGIGGVLGWVIGTLYPSLNQPLAVFDRFASRIGVIGTLYPSLNQPHRLTLLSGVIGSLIGAATSRRVPPLR